MIRTALTLSLFGGAALLAASPLPAQTAAAPDDTEAKIEQLQAQVNAMQAELQALKASAVKVTPPLEKPDWTASTTIGGKAFLNVSTISHKQDGVDQIDNGTQTDVKRFYLIVDHKFNNVFSANLTTDFRYNANGTSRDTVVFVKKAWLQAKLSDALFIRVGAADLPWVPFVEDIYGYRFVENVLVDRTRYGTSTDWGVHVGGSFLNGRLSYAASAINGAGFKTLSRSSNTIDLEGRISARPLPNIVLGVGGYTGKLGKSNDIMVTLHRATRVDALAAYVDKRIRVGVEVFRATNWNNVTTAARDRTDGWSAFASYAVTPVVSVFGRYDRVEPNKLTNASAKEHYFNFGVDYVAYKGIDLALVYKRDKADNIIFATSNGNIGGVGDGAYDEVGLFSQVKF